MKPYTKTLMMDCEYGHTIRVLYDNDGPRIEVCDEGEKEFKFALAFSPKEIPVLIEMLEEISE